MRRVVAIVGATATGKTELGEAVAARIGGEIVCADARQVFRELEIGTGKPSAAERAERPHHLFEALALGERPSAGGWARLARAACGGILDRGATPVLVGGSGLYLRALQEGLHAEPPHDAGIRARLLQELAASGPETLHARLAAVDPPTASRLAVRDRQRILRALEVHEASGRSLSWWHLHAAREPFEADWRVVLLELAPAALAVRIEARTRAMFAGGLLEETRGLLESGRREPLAALRAIGYDEAIAVLDGHADIPLARARTDARTRAMAKRQRTWFRHQLRGARRLDGSATAAERLAGALAVTEAGPGHPG
jgi:tRNA dimethylallyltransferase